FLKEHLESDADISVSVIPAEERHASNFGLLKANAERRIIEFREKPPTDQLPAMRVDTTDFGLSREEADGKPYLASMGVYLFKFAALREMLKDDQYTDF